MKKALVVVLLSVMIIPFAFAAKTDKFDSFYVVAEFSFDSFEKFSFENVQAGVFFHPLEYGENPENAKNVKLIFAYSYSTLNNPEFNGPRFGVSYRVNNGEDENLFDLNAKILFSNDFDNLHVSGFDFSVQKSNVYVDTRNNGNCAFSDEDIRAMSDNSFMTNNPDNKYKNVGYANIGYFLSLDLDPMKSGLHFDGKFKFTENACIKSSFITHFLKDGIALDDFVFSAKYSFASTDKSFTGTADMAVDYSYDNPDYANGITVGFEAVYAFASITPGEMKDDVLAQILEQTTVKLDAALEAGVYGNLEDYKFNLNLASFNCLTSLTASKTIARIKEKNFGALSTSLGIAYYNNLLNSQDEKGLFLTYSFAPGIAAGDDVYRVNSAWKLEDCKINRFIADGKIGGASKGASGLIFGN